MHIYFSGIGGAGMGPLARIALQAGYMVSGSDKRDSGYIRQLRSGGIKNIHIGQNREQIAALHGQNPIDWFVYSSAVSIEQPNHPEIIFARDHGIKASKRDELLNKIIVDSDQKLVAVAGTHGKTTTTAMIIWLLHELAFPASYSVGAKLSFGDMGHFEKAAKYFVYECDEYDRNFLAFSPYVAAISGVAYDHQDIYPTETEYQKAFQDFLTQSQHIILWQQDADKLNVSSNDHTLILRETDLQTNSIALPGHVNRLDAWLAVNTVHQLTRSSIQQLVSFINLFPGVSRRFEKIISNLYTDYAHTPEKIAGCLEIAREISDKVVIVYEPLTNKRQHFIQDIYEHLFDGVSKVYWVPSYLTREDPNQHILTPAELIQNMSKPHIAEPAVLDGQLKQAIKAHLHAGDQVICLSGGGAGSLDEWVRANFTQENIQNT